MFKGRSNYRARIQAMPEAGARVQWYGGAWPGEALGNTSLWAVSIAHTLADREVRKAFAGLRLQLGKVPLGRCAGERCHPEEHHGQGVGQHCDDVCGACIHCVVSTPGALKQGLFRKLTVVGVRYAS